MSFGLQSLAPWCSHISCFIKASGCTWSGAQRACYPLPLLRHVPKNQPSTRLQAALLHLQRLAEEEAAQTDQIPIPLHSPSEPLPGWLSPALGRLLRPKNAARIQRAKLFLYKRSRVWDIPNLRLIRPQKLLCIGCSLKLHLLLLTLLKKKKNKTKKMTKPKTVLGKNAAKVPARGGGEMQQAEEITAVHNISSFLTCNRGFIVNL